MATAAPPADLLIDAPPRTRSTGLWMDALRNVLRQRNARIGLTILGILLFAALAADVLSAYDPDKVLLAEGTKRLTPPCIHLLGCPAAQPEHLFGIDANGRDEFSRVLHGARISLQVGILTIGGSIVLGSLLGLIAGYAGGMADTLL